ncbi:hypothetical protein [Saccharothrix syringae]|uniref:Uncharacterized protein n=1 Tax=Saccharothrix syringae TaxID=103733 RepID=A0A5Q0GXH1_SACSY|nr:hypothetical protein [Saccharothrix syringae]QFZ18234.1 hypothetical protein EKG83_12730 [Saccharothrix syringae]
MWSNEEDLRRVLKSEVDGPAPAARADLVGVVRRGRRRLLVLRTGAVAGTLALVGVVGFGAAALGGLAGGPSDPAVGPVVNPTAGPTGSREPLAAPVWTTLSVPARTPVGTFRPGATAPPPPGRSIVPAARCDLGTIGQDSTRWLLPHPPPRVLNAWVTSVGEVASPAQVSEPHAHTFPANPRKHPDSVDGHTRWIDVTDAGGTGSVWLDVGRTPLAPLAAADDELFAVGNCAPPRRAVRDNGAVLQLYELQVLEPFQSLKLELHVYAPSGDVYRLTLVNHGSPDFEVQEDQRAFNRTGAGRDTLPLTEEQLTRIGLAVADASS